MKIKSIKANIHQIFARVPLLEHPLRRRIVFCEVETDEGHKGHGLTGGAFLPHAIVTALNKEFLPVVKDMDPRDTEAIHEKVWWKMNQRSMTGVISSALSCVDIACWDIHGKATGRTVAQLLGGARDWAPTYCTFGFPEYDRDQLRQAAKDRLAEGHLRLPRDELLEAPHRHRGFHRDVPDHLEPPDRGVALRLLEQELRVGEDGRQRVVEVVGEPPDGLPQRAQVDGAAEGRGGLVEPPAQLPCPAAEREDRTVQLDLGAGHLPGDVPDLLMVGEEERVGRCLGGIPSHPVRDLPPELLEHAPGSQRFTS